MIRWALPPVCAVWTVVWSAPLAAQTPPTLPAHDVAISYRLEGAAQDVLPGIHAAAVHLDWDAERQRLRVEPQGFPGYALIDLHKATALLVDPALRGAIALPVRKSDLDPIRLRDARLQARGAAVVAGRSCTEYAVLSHRGAGAVCLAPDGVALRGSGSVDGRHGSFVAVAVDDAPLPEALFTPPARSFRLALPRSLRLGR